MWDVNGILRHIYNVEGEGEAGRGVRWKDAVEGLLDTLFLLRGRGEIICTIFHQDWPCNYNIIC